MGASANAALEYTTKMGSLFQGSGIEQSKSAEMSMAYAKRAADVASVMGVPVADAMEAVTGAAKGNFTMMDNLGVAMNDTTLKAYALAEGYAKPWSEMSNAEKNTVAYEMFLAKTSQYAGNFEKENSSLAGSMDIFTSSWENVLSSLGDPVMLDAAMKQMAKAVTGMIDSLLTALPGIIDGIGTILKDGVPMILKALTTLLPEVVKLIATTLPTLVTSLVEALPGLIKVLADALLLLLPVIIKVLVDLVGSLATMIPMIITTIVDLLVKGLPMLIKGAIQLLMAIIDALPVIIEALVKALPLLVQAIVDVLIMATPLLLEAVFKLIVALVKTLIESGPQLLATVFQLFFGIIGAIAQMVTPLMDAGFAAFGKLVEGCVTAVSGLWDGISGFFESIPGFIGDSFANVGEIGKNLIMGLWNGISNVQGWILDQIMGFGAAVLDGFKNIFDIHSPSRRMRDEIGKMAGLGVGVGITDSTKQVLKDASKFSTKITSGLDIAANVDYGTSGAFADRTAERPNVTINQRVDRPKNMLENYLNSKRGVSAGLAVA
jgi:phage-related protein